MGGRIGDRLLESPGYRSVGGCLVLRADWFVTRLLASVVVASLAAACSSAPSASQGSTPASLGPTPSPSPIVLTAYPSGFPTAYSNVVDAGPALYTPVAGGLSREYTGTLRAGDGTIATYTATLVENRVPVAEVTCGGLMYGDLFTSENPVITFDIEFPDWGRAVLAATDRIVVFSSSRNASSPAICDELTGGTYQFEFTGGSILQLKSGTWHQDADGLLTFDEPPPASSPSESPG